MPLQEQADGEWVRHTMFGPWRFRVCQKILANLCSLSLERRAFPLPFDPGHEPVKILLVGCAA